MTRSSRKPRTETEELSHLSDSAGARSPCTCQPGHACMFIFTSVDVDHAIHVHHPPVVAQPLAQKNPRVRPVRGHDRAAIGALVALDGLEHLGNARRNT